MTNWRGLWLFVIVMLAVGEVALSQAKAPSPSTEPAATGQATDDALTQTSPAPASDGEAAQPETDVQPSEPPATSPDPAPGQGTQALQQPAEPVDPKVDTPKEPEGKDGFARLLALVAVLLALASGALAAGLGWFLRKLRSSWLAVEQASTAQLEELRGLRNEVQALRGPRQSTSAAGAPRSSAAAPGSAGGGAPTPSSAPESREPAAGQPNPAAAASPLDAMVQDLLRLPEGEVGVLLVQLHQEVPRLAFGFDDPELRHELEQLGERLLERLRRFTAAAERKQLESGWVETDLIPLLDHLARLQSAAMEEARNGNSRAGELGRRLQDWLYRQFSDAIRKRGWFTLDPVVPFETRFDPGVHHALAGKDVAGLSRVVVAVKAVGRRHPENGAVQQKAQVIVAR